MLQAQFTIRGAYTTIRLGKSLSRLVKFRCENIYTVCR